MNSDYSKPSRARAGPRPGRPGSGLRRSGAASRHGAASGAAAPHPSLALATILAVYIAVVIGRPGDLLHLGSLPIAKIIGGLALIVAWSNKDSLSRIRLRDVPLAKLTLLFMAWSTSTIAFSIWRGRTIAVITGTVVATIVAVFLIVKAATTWRAVRRMLAGTVGAAVALSATAMRTSFAGRAGFDGNYDPNDFAYVLVGLLPCVCAFAATSKGWKRVAFAGAALWAVVSILLTQSRGGLLGLALDVLLMVLFLPVSKAGRVSVAPTRRELIVRVLVVTIMSLAIWFRLPSDAQGRLESITTADTGYNVTDRQGRVAIWSRNLPLVAKRPWGFGAGTFEAVDLFYGGGSFRAPHNIYLQVAIELGLPGFGLFLGMLVIYFREVRSLTMSRGDRHPEFAVFAKALGISQAGLCLSGFFLSELYANELWLTVALLCAVIVWVRPRAVTAKADRSRSARTLVPSDLPGR